MANPDPDRFLSGNDNSFDPLLGQKFGALSCFGWCWSSVSQAEADLCAYTQQFLCTVDNGGGGGGGSGPGGSGPGPGPYGNPPFVDPNGNPAQVFPNAAQSCTVTCPDGTVSSYTLPAGSIYALTQAQANYNAAGLACQIANTNRFCFQTESPLPSGCPGEPYSTTIVSMGQSPLTYEIVGGGFAPGLSFSSDGVLSGTIDTSALGDYTATIKVTDGFGNTRLKNFILGVCGAVNSTTLSSYTVGTPYSQFITGVSSVGCGTGAQSFMLIGILPPGLSLDPNSGLISGIPTGDASGDYSFTIRVTTVS